jgi:hypothetical protein
VDVTVSIEDLRKRKLFIATPMYGGQCAGMYTRSVADLTGEMIKMGIELRSYFLFNESLITRARNYCADEFLRSDATHMLFIDSDIGFNPQDVLVMLALMGPDCPYGVMAAPYPKKNISWEKIKQAVDKGAADKDPNQLDEFVGDFVFNPLGDKGRFSLNDPVAVLESGTGFMMITRETFKRYSEHFGDSIKYRPDHARSDVFDGSRMIDMYFQAEIEPQSRRYLSEDYLFCQNLNKIGVRIGLCPWMKLQHVGSYIFGGSLAALAAIGASATADPSKLVKRKDK